MAHSCYRNYYTICFITIYMPLYCSLLLCARYSYYYTTRFTTTCLLFSTCLLLHALLGPDASAYANGLVKTAGFTSALCIATAEGGLRKRHNVSCEESPGRGDCAQVDVCRCINSVGWQKLRDTPASRVSANINGHVGSPTVRQVCCTYVTYVHAVTTRADNATTRRPSEVRKFLAAVRFLARQETPFTSCVSRYLPILLRGAKRFMFAAEVCKVHAVRHPRRWKFPFGNVMTDFARRNRREWIEKRRAIRQLRLVSHEINKKTKKVGILRVTRISANFVRRARAEYFTSLCCARYGER